MQGTGRTYDGDMGNMHRRVPLAQNYGACPIFLTIISQ